MESRAVVTVLKSGEWQHQHIERAYGPQHAIWLQEQVEQWAPKGTRFYCLSDLEIPGVEVIPLTQDWPGWWSKLELFQHDLGPVLYLDLDTVVVGPLDELMTFHHRFTMFSQYPHRYADHPKLLPEGAILNSGVMAWQGPRHDLFETFRRNPEHWMKACSSMPYCWGDQGFLSLFAEPCDTWAQLFPGAVASYKWDLPQRRPLPTTRLVCFEGNPKPWDSGGAWVPALSANTAVI